MEKMGRFAGISVGRDPDDLFGETVVAEIKIQLRRNGAMSVAGSINDEDYAKHLLLTAMDTLTSYHARRRLGNNSPLVVPAHDTSLVGTPLEKRLIESQDELHKALERRG